MQARPSRYYLNVDSAAVVPGRILLLTYLEIDLLLTYLEIDDKSMVLRYTIDPGINAAELASGWRSYLWGAAVEDDVGGEYLDGLNSGGLEPDVPTLYGDRFSSDVPSPSAKFLTISVFSPRSRRESRVREVFARHIRLDHEPPMKPWTGTSMLGGAVGVNSWRISARILDSRSCGTAARCARRSIPGAKAWPPPD